MNDPIRSSSTEVSFYDEPLTQTVRSKRSRKWPFLVGGVAILVLLCIGVCVVTFGSSLVTAVTQKGDLEAVPDQFMEAMANKKADDAYALFSNRAQRQVPLSETEGMLEGAKFLLFEGYESLQIQTLNIGPAVSTDPNQPQGTVARVSGSLHYAGGYVGNFQAILEKEDKAWKLHYIHINVPPDKLEGYSGGE